MLFLEELTCPQCHCDFITASELLKHFTTHALEEFIIPDVEKDEQKHGLNKKTIPDLRPIIRSINNECSEENVNPSIFCEVTFDEGKVNNEETPKFERKFPKKYKCLYCKKTYGWSTDLKRHIFTHTGEKPFKCKLCDISYTRRILLHKHMTKYHRKPKIPDLKPINSKITVKGDGNSI